MADPNNGVGAAMRRATKTMGRLNTLLSARSARKKVRAAVHTFKKKLKKRKKKPAVPKSLQRKAGKALRRGNPRREMRNR